MSWLLFNQKAKQIEIYEGKAPNYCAKQYPSKKGAWSAHNDVATKSKGSWPSGVFAWSHYNLHSDMGQTPGCHPTSYGCFGIHVFKVPSRTGMGVHAGRTQGEPNKLGGKTEKMFSCFYEQSHGRKTEKRTVPHLHEDKYWSVVENRRVAGGGVVQRQVL